MGDRETWAGASSPFISSKRRKNKGKRKGDDADADAAAAAGGGEKGGDKVLRDVWSWLELQPVSGVAWRIITMFGQTKYQRAVPLVY